MQSPRSGAEQGGSKGRGHLQQATGVRASRSSGQKVRQDRRFVGTGGCQARRFVRTGGSSGQEVRQDRRSIETGGSSPTCVASDILPNQYLSPPKWPKWVTHRDNFLLARVWDDCMAPPPSRHAASSITTSLPPPARDHFSPTTRLASSPLPDSSISLAAHVRHLPLGPG
jgi:hypothetical protein